MSLTRGLVLDVANQLGGAMPGVVTLHDWSRYQNDGAMTNVTWTQLPTGLWVMNFNGIDAYIILPTEGYFLADVGTILIWLKANANGTTHSPLGVGATAGANDRLGFFIRNIDDLAYFTVLSGGGTAEVNTANTFDWTEWHLIGATIESGAVRIYVEGSEEVTAGAEANIRFFGGISGAKLTSLGARRNNGAYGSFFAGQISLSGICNYILSPAQIRARYHSQKWLFGVAS